MNGSVKREQWWVDGQRHRDDGLPTAIDYYKNGSVKLEEWWVDGQLQREESHKCVFFFKWRKDFAKAQDDQPHRDNSQPESVSDQSPMRDVYDELYQDGDKPTEIDYYGVELVEREKWCVDGQPHRDNDLPAVIKYGLPIDYGVQGSVEREEWWIDGQRHRDNDLAAVIDYYRNGSVKLEQWWVDGQLQREESHKCVYFFTLRKAFAKMR